MEKIKVNYKVNADEDLVSELKKRYESCPKAVKYIKTLEIPESLIDENIIKINDMVCDINYCSKCPGLEKCSKETPRLVTRITYSHGVVDRELRPCKKYLERLDFENHFVINDINKNFVSSNNILNDKKKNQQSQSALLFKRLTEVKQYNWYYFYGLDKKNLSIFAYSLVVELIKQHNYRVAYLNSPNRIRDLNNLSFQKTVEGKREFERVMSLYCNIPVLVLEDFGNEYVNDYIRDTIIFPIINTRASKKLCTIFASDFCLDDIKKLYTTSNNNDLRASQIVRQIKYLSEQEINIDELSSN